MKVNHKAWESGCDLTREGDADHGQDDEVEDVGGDTSHPEWPWVRMLGGEG